MAPQFDTLAVLKELEDAGIDRKQARAMAARLHVAADADKPVTRPELEAALAAREARIVWRLTGAMVAVAGLAVAAVELIP